MCLEPAQGLAIADRNIRPHDHARSLKLTTDDHAPTDEDDPQTTATFRYTPNLHRGQEPSSRPSEVSAAAPARPGSGVLVIIRAPSSGATGGRFLLTAPVSVAGRHPDSAVFLNDVTVSHRHAEFRWLGDRYCVVDTGSLNGTYVNRVPVDTLPLTDGDEIQIGRFRLAFSCQRESEDS